MFWFVKTVHYYSAGPESKTGLLFAYMAGGEGGGGGWLEVLKCLVRGSQNFSTCLMCVCVGEWGEESGSVPHLP